MQDEFDNYAKARSETVAAICKVFAVKPRMVLSAAELDWINGVNLSARAEEIRAKSLIQSKRSDGKSAESGTPQVDGR